MQKSISPVIFWLAAGLSLGATALSLPPAGAQSAHATVTHAQHGSDTPLFEKLGDYRFSISTKNPLTQRYFDQGLMLAYGFNHAEAARSFKAAAALDPACAMCHWGLAYVLGPNINAPMAPEAVPEAWRAVRRAVTLAGGATPRERDYIRALEKRYAAQPRKDRRSLDLAYARAMGEVARRHPTDLDAATLHAEALMDTTPWDYWQPDGQPRPAAREILATLQSVLQRKPNHPGANHFYIHAVEKQDPELGVEAADRLMALVPGSGHLVHMASHIYIRVGRYHDAVTSNLRGIEADDAYLGASHAQGIYPLAYKPHNHHFLWFAASMTGQSEIARRAAERTAQVDAKLMRSPELAGALQHFHVIPLFTALRFSQWDKIEAAPAPDGDLKYPTGVWHYAQGQAALAVGQPQATVIHLERLRALAADPELETIKIWAFNSTASVLKIAAAVLAGDLAMARGQHDQALSHLRTAVKLEDALVYTEPADWYQPTRQSLAGALLKAGRAEEAERIYREDLKLYPENGWSLSGLTQSLQAQGKAEQAQAVQERFARAWQHADVTLAAQAQP